jgi:DNA-binding NtrC family response regulator/tetratricopeptide (TPR) repeat protein
MQLFADRFAIDEDGGAVDLATGRRIELRRWEGLDPRDRVEQLRWSIRCDRWRALHHRAVARLIDCGPVGRAGRFEAWDCGPAWQGSADEAARIRTITERFLCASGLTTSPAATVHTRNGNAVVLPGPGDGHEQAIAGDRIDAAPLALRGMTSIARSAVRALAEMFESVGDRRPAFASVWGAPGSVKTTVVLEVARAARLKGFIPVASRMLATGYTPLWTGRNLLVVHDEGDGRASEVWPAFLLSTLRTPLPHALLLVGERESSSVEGIGLDPVTVDDLIAAVCPAPLGPQLLQRVRRAALESRGLPGRFARLLWPDWTGDRGVPRKTPLPRAAERSTSYATDEHVHSGAAVMIDAPAGGAWASPGELAMLRNRVGLAKAQLAAGRHAPALRQLRHVSSALARRDAWSDAAGATLTVARALLGRGRAREAVGLLDEARSYAERSGDHGSLLDAAILGGEARIDLIRFDEAETILAAAIATAVHWGDQSRMASASMSLARCLFWRGQYVEAASALERAVDDTAPSTRTRRGCLRARIAIGLGDAAAAMGMLADLHRGADDPPDSGRRATVSYTAGLAHLAVGDLDAAVRDARDSISAARAARDPLRALRARLLAVEADRRRGHMPAVAFQLDRLKRVRASLPPLLRAQLDLVAGLAGAGGAVDADSIRRRIGDAGVPGLALYVSSEARRGGVDPAVDDLLVILRTCQTAEDEAVVLKEVCVHVRGQLRAIGSAFVARHGTGATGDILASDGGRVEPEIAARAMDTAIVIRPHRHGDRIEGAAPVLYGGTPIGALSARWSIGSSYDAERAATVLAMAATAAAPLVATAMAHRARASMPEGAAVAPLLGATPAMADLREAAQRAGAAPFGVLIVGESGSGKELVARAIHRSSARRDGPFRTLNCAALPDDLVESELFGHARGAFTGAIADRPGVFEDAHGGTLFLDEVGELSPRAQAKILRVIQESELRRVGENMPRRVDVRLVAATNRDLSREVDDGRFRLDLLYRLDVVRIAVPPLRERADDVAVLAARFWADATARVNSRATLAPATVAALARYGWPGNVRELQNVLAALAVRSPRRGLVPPSALPIQFGEGPRDEMWRLDDARRTFEERFVRAALVRTGGHRTRAAAELGVSRQGLTKLLSRLGISDVP